MSAPETETSECHTVPFDVRSLWLLGDVGLL